MNAADVIRKAIELIESGRLKVGKANYFSNTQDPAWASATQPKTIDCACALGVLAFSAAQLDPSFDARPVSMEGYLFGFRRGDAERNEASESCCRAVWHVENALIEDLKSQTRYGAVHDFGRPSGFDSFHSGMIAKWNDHPLTLQADVLRVLRIALESCDAS